MKLSKPLTFKHIVSVFMAINEKFTAQHLNKEHIKPKFIRVGEWLWGGGGTYD